MTAYYFAYGSNMNPARMRERGLQFIEIRPAVLPGMRLVFNKRASNKTGIAYANIAFAPDAQVEGLLYKLVDNRQIGKLDYFEGTPYRYSREIYSLRCGADTVSAWVYIANRAMISADLLPERWYLRHLLAGEPWLSTGYLQGLRRQACIDDI